MTRTALVVLLSVAGCTSDNPELSDGGAADQAAGNPPGLNAETVDYFLRTGTYSIAKARRVLGYEPRVDLDEGMARTEAWLRGIGLLPTP